MGGQIFTQNCVMVSYDELNKIHTLVQDINALLPLRLNTKKEYHDIDIILYDEQKVIQCLETSHYTIIDKKAITLAFGTYTYHLLLHNHMQIDILKPFSETSGAITQAFFSYECANVFFKKMIPIASKDCKISYLGLLCHNNTVIFATDQIVRLDSNTRLITDVNVLFALLDLEYARFLAGFEDEFDLFKYLQTSKHFSQIKFHMNGKFKHDIARLPSFKRLFESGFLSSMIQ